MVLMVLVVGKHIFHFVHESTHGEGSLSDRCVNFLLILLVSV